MRDPHMRGCDTKAGALPWRQRAMRDAWVTPGDIGLEPLAPPERKAWRLDRDKMDAAILIKCIAPVGAAAGSSTSVPRYVSGFCKAELIANLPERKTWLTRASLLWVIEGVSTKHPTLQQLHALSAGDRCKVSPRQSKCDATGEVYWGDRPIALAYADVLANAAKALAHLELAFPIEASAREATPLLTADNATPLT
eukprot:5683713-Pleurochrysis_carterae.AAC.1